MARWMATSWLSLIIQYVLFQEIFILVVGLEGDMVQQCGKAYNCFRHPADCTSLSTCNAVATFQPGSTNNTILIQLITKHVWVALGQNDKEEKYGMVKLRGQYCIKDELNPIFGTFNGNNLNRNAMPSWVVNPISSINQLDAHEDKGILKCRYERLIKPNAADEEFLYDMNQKLYTAIAFGDVAWGTVPGPHNYGSYLMSADKIDYLSGGDNIPAKSVDNSYKAHGILMMIGYIFLATGGMFMSRYMKTVTSDIKIQGKAAWFVLHVLVMIFCLLCSIAGFVIILVKKGGWSDRAGKHHFTGLFAIIAFLIQPVMALLRPSPDHKRRPIFNYLHRFVGISGWFLGSLAVIFALQMYGIDYNLSISFIAITIILCILLDGIIYIIGRRNSVVVFKDQSFNGEVEVKSVKNSDKEKFILLLFLSLVVSFALGVTVYLSYTIGTM